ncbi:MAG: hypothetical protein AB8B73_13415 [Ekhidna sp.]
MKTLKSLTTNYIMILLDSKTFVKKIIKPGLIILISVFLGCETANDVGVKDPFGGNVSVKYEEILLPASNIYIDSLRTDGERKILVGSYNNPITGTVEAQGYFQYYFDEGTFPGDSLRFERMAAQFKIDSKIGNTSFENVLIQEAEDTLNSSLVYLRTAMENLSTPPIAMENVSINRDEINIEFTSEYGEALFESSKEGSEVFNLLGGGGDYVSPTLGITMDNSESLLRLDLDDEDSWIKLFMRSDRVDTIYELKFNFYNGTIGTEYSNVERSREGTEFVSIQGNSDLQIASGETIIEPLSGISTAFDLSNVYDFFLDNGEIVINSATFSFEFQGEGNRDTLTSNALYFRKSDLSFFGPASELNEFNNIVATDNSYANPVSGGALNFIPSLTYLNDAGMGLNLDATNFLRNIYSTSVDSTDLFFRNPFVDQPRLMKDLIMISKENTSISRTIIKDNGIKLKIFYTESN